MYVYLQFDKCKYNELFIFFLKKNIIEYILRIIDPYNMKKKNDTRIPSLYLKKKNFFTDNEIFIFILRVRCY